MIAVGMENQDDNPDDLDQDGRRRQVTTSKWGWDDLSDLPEQLNEIEGAT